MRFTGGITVAVRSAVAAVVVVAVVLGGQLSASADDTHPSPRTVDTAESIAAQAAAQLTLQQSTDATQASAAADAAASTVAPAPSARTFDVAQAATASAFTAGNIITDSLFYNGAAMAVGDVQAFLDQKGSACTAGALCLKNYTQTTYTQAADEMCGEYVGASNETAATIVARVGQLCGINETVLLTLIQKESSLVAATNPTAGDYTAATGYGCPKSTEVCNQYYNGFYNQVYNAAWQFKRYLNPPGTTATFTWYPVGTPVAIKYHEDPTVSAPTDCGSSPVTIANNATAALYYYTPYQPNAAALANPYGDGDVCSSYGNRNFWVVYSDWFGTPDQFFVDVTTGSTFYGDVQWMSRLGLTTGTLNTDHTRSYLPVASVSRQAMAAFLYRYSAQTFVPPTTPSFSDVGTTSPFYTAIEWMKSKGITTGNADGTFNPGGSVTRESMAAFLARYMNQAQPDPATPSFTDVPATNPFYTAIEWMKSSGLTTGYTDGTYRPGASVTREAMAAFLHRMSALG